MNDPFAHPLLGNMAAMVRLIRQNPEQAKLLAGELAQQGILPPFAGPSELLQHIEPFAKRTSQVSQQSIAQNAAPFPQGSSGATPIMPTPDQLSATLMGRTPNG